MIVVDYLQSGMVVSLQEALTPSPLFTWYSPTSATADIQMADLDTCVKYNTAATTNSNGVSEFHGSTTFTGSRHRWTVQLDNMGPQPGHIFVGLVNSEQHQAPSSSILAAALPTVVSSRVPALPGGPSTADATASLNHSNSGATVNPAETAAALSSSLGPVNALVQPGMQQRKWGVWVKLPGAPAAGAAAAPVNTAVPPRFGDVQFVESVSNHCCITVDLDLIGGYAKFFKNGHLLGQAFTGLTAPISPALAFLQVGYRQLKAHCRMLRLFKVGSCQQTKLLLAILITSNDMHGSNPSTFNFVAEWYMRQKVQLMS